MTNTPFEAIPNHYVVCKPTYNWIVNPLSNICHDNLLSLSQDGSKEFPFCSVTAGLKTIQRCSTPVKVTMTLTPNDTYTYSGFNMITELWNGFKDNGDSRYPLQIQQPLDLTIIGGIGITITSPIIVEGVIDLTLQGIKFETIDNKLVFINNYRFFRPSNLIVTNCRFEFNSGELIRTENTNTTVKDSIFTNNFGQLIEADRGDLTLSKLRIVNNITPLTLISASESKIASIDSIEFLDNEFIYDGGLMYCGSTPRGATNITIAPNPNRGLGKNCLTKP